MPFGVHGNDGAICDWLLAFGTAYGKHILVVLLAIGLAVPLIEWAIRQGLLAGAIAHKTALVPIFAHSAYGALQDGLLAGGTGARIAFDKAIAAHGLTVLYIKGGILDLFVAMAAQEMLRMPGLAQSRYNALCDRLIALVANDILVLLTHPCGGNYCCCCCYRSYDFRLLSITMARAQTHTQTHAQLL